ncbi:MAG: hypothetical protein ACTSR8_12120 [Promethearchaeota archaeon]
MIKKKIGLLIDRPHLEYKVAEFLEYIRSVAEVTIYLEEELVLNPRKSDFREDIFLLKGKGDLLLNFTKFIEKESNIQVINSYKGTWYASHRYLSSIKLKKAGIPVPDFSLIPIIMDPPYEDYIVKNIIDQKVYSFKPQIEKRNGHIQVKDERAVNESKGEKNYQYYYYQRFIKSKWEYKIYGIGEKILFFKQLPILVNPNKMESRKTIPEISELREYAIRAMEILDLKLTSIDFLKSKEGNYYLTDINSTPNFNYIKNGPKIVGDFLIQEARR